MTSIVLFTAVALVLGIVLGSVLSRWQPAFPPLFLAGVVVFLAWDLVAVGLGFYRRGEAGVMTGVHVAPGIPLEEVFFILFLCYVTLVLHRLLARFVFGRPDIGAGGR